MQLPVSVKRRIEEQADALGFPALKARRRPLSDAYREGRAARLGAAERTAAYLVTRMPATYAAAHAVLREVGARMGAIGSILDAGAGTGAASLAARAHFPDAAITLVERDPAFAAAARQWLPDATLIAADIARLVRSPAARSGDRRLLPGRVRRAAGRAALAGRARGPGLDRARNAARLRAHPKVRGDLLAAGARMIAPCPAETRMPDRRSRLVPLRRARGAIFAASPREGRGTGARG